MNLLVCDIDGSLVAESPNPFEPDASLPPNPVMCALLKAVALNDDWFVALVTSRPEKYQQGTMQWLTDHCAIEAEVIMREENNWAQAPDFKLKKIASLVEQFEPVHVVCIDSRDDVCAAYREAGYTVMAPFK